MGQQPESLEVSARHKLSELCTQNLGALYLPHGLVETSSRLEQSAKYGVSLMERTHLRLRHREMQRQMNLEQVLALVTSKCQGRITAQPIDQDWVSLFFSFVFDVSDHYMQKLWANAMVSELQTPGSISKCSLKFLHSLDLWEVRAFKKVAVSAFVSKSGYPFLFRGAQGANQEDPLFFESRMLSHCISAGLIREDVWPLERGFTFQYQDLEQVVNTHAGFGGKHTGFYTQQFTKIGSDLYRMILESDSQAKRQAQEEVWQTLSDFIHLKSVA